MQISRYDYQSCFGPYIRQFIQEKRAAGFIYGHEEWELKHFDSFCTEESITELNLSREVIQKWGALREGEALSTCSGRTSVLRQFAFFLISIGIPAHIPSGFHKSEKTVIHILTEPEISAIFEEIDNKVPAVNHPSFHRLSIEYKVIFRLIYCCGLRISEARKLRWKDVDLDHGTLRILHSKGYKDRLVYMADDLNELLKIYGETIHNTFCCYSEWVFPAREPEKCLSNGTIESQFRHAWLRTTYAADCDKSPTVHCLRHGFVIKRINIWMEENISLKEMLPFLSRYLVA